MQDLQTLKVSLQIGLRSFDRVQHRTAAAWSNSAQGEGKWHGHAVLRTHSLPFLAKSSVEAGVSTMPHGNPITNQAPSSSEGRGALRRRVLPTHLGLITHNHSHQTPSSHQLLLAKAETWRGPILLRSKQPLVLTLFVAEGGGRSLLVPARLSQPPRGSGQAPGVFIAIPIAAKRLRHWRGGGCAL